MVHKTLISGTAYEIGGGKTLIGGTAYEIDKGRTLVGGTVYEVGFAKLVTVRVTSNSLYSSGSYSTDASYITPDGSTGTLNTAGTYELPAGTTLMMKVEEYEKTGHVYVNDTSVGKTDYKGYLYYSYTLTTNIVLTHKYYGGANIYITEE